MPKSKKLGDIIVIESFYNAAHSLLKADNKKDALKVLYEAMPSDLYDKSLDILNNRNCKNVSKSVKKLIRRVDKIINPTLIADIEE